MIKHYFSSKRGIKYIPPFIKILSRKFQITLLNLYRICYALYRISICLLRFLKRLDQLVHNFFFFKYWSTNFLDSRLNYKPCIHRIKRTFFVNFMNDGCWPNKEQTVLFSVRICSNLKL